MDQRKFVEIPGDSGRTFELPPLLLTAEARISAGILETAGQIVETDDLLRIPDESSNKARLESAKTDLAVNMANRYLQMLASWHMGNAVLEWIRQCEMTFEYSASLRPLLRPDIWPHSSRASFVRLLSDKAVREEQEAQTDVGLRLTFRQPPPIECFSDHFLFYLEQKVMPEAYSIWASKTPPPVWSLPPERFHFEVRFL